jgi:hypothetical protein
MLLYILQLHNLLNIVIFYLNYIFYHKQKHKHKNELNHLNSSFSE